MVKLTYIGAMVRGMLNSKGFKLNVERGKTYDIPSRCADELLKTKNWVKATKPKKEKQVEVDNSDEKVDKEDKMRERLKTEIIDNGGD